MNIYTYTHTEGEDTLNGRVGPGNSESLARNCHTNSIHGGGTRNHSNTDFILHFQYKARTLYVFFPENYNLDRH